MRILILASYGPSLVNFRGPLIAALIAAGHEVHAAAPTLTEEVRAELFALGAIEHETPLDRQGTGLWGDLVYAKRLVSLCRSVNPDLVITYTIKPNIWGALAGSLTRTRSVALVTGLGIMFTDMGRDANFKSKLMRRFARWLYRRASDRNWRLVFQNPDDLADFEAAGCLGDRSKVRMMNGSGVDLCQYPPAPLPTKPIFLMISRILGAKGVREYARAAISVKKIHPQVSFRLVGFFDEGPDAISRSEVAQWEAEGLEYLGPTESVQGHLADCQVYVLPSYREGTPRSVLEAMATGRPILTTNVPGCRETVIEGKNGFLVPVRDVDALIQKMKEFVENPRLVTSMAAASLEIAREKYDVNKVNQHLMKDLDIS